MYQWRAAFKITKLKLIYYRIISAFSLSNQPGFFETKIPIITTPIYIWDYESDFLFFLTNHKYK